MTEKGKPPVRKTRSGAIELAKWENELPEGKGKITNYTFQKSYKDKKTDEWKKTQSYHQRDLMNLRALIDETMRTTVKEDQPKESEE